MRTSKRTVDSGLRLRQVRRVHSRAFVCASGHVGSVHLSTVQAGIRHNDCVVFRKTGIAAVQVIVKRRNTPVHAADNPVITNVQVSESTTGNSFPLFLRYGSAKVLPSVDRVVRPGIVIGQLRQNGIDPFHVFLQILFEVRRGDSLDSRTIMDKKQAVITCGKDSIKVSKFLCLNANNRHFFIPPYVSNLPK